jgi:mycoredoxin
MVEQEIVIYGTSWCGDCIRARCFFNRNGISYHWVNIDDDKAGEHLVMRINHGMRSVPTVLFPNGDVLVEPSNAELKQKLSSLLRR